MVFFNPNRSNKNQDMDNDPIVIELQGGGPSQQEEYSMVFAGPSMNKDIAFDDKKAVNQITQQDIQIQQKEIYRNSASVYTS